MTDGSYDLTETRHIPKAVSLCVPPTQHDLCSAFLKYAFDLTHKRDKVNRSYLESDLMEAAGLSRCLTKFHPVSEWTEKQRVTYTIICDILDVSRMYTNGIDAELGKGFRLHTYTYRCPQCQGHEFDVGYSAKFKRIMQCTTCKRWQVSVKKSSEKTQVAQKTPWLTRIRKAIKCLTEK